MHKSAMPIVAARMLMIASVLATSPVAANSVATTTVSSSTLSDEFYCTGTLRVFDPIELTRLHLRIPHYSDCQSAIPGAKVSRYPFPPGGWVVDDLPEGFHGPADLVTCTAELFAEQECQLTLEEGPSILIYSAEGPAGPVAERPTVCPVTIDCDRWPCDPAGPYYEEKCGDTDGNRVLSAIDALAVLRVAVSLNTCALTICDTDRDTTIDVADALRVLRAAVGLDVLLACPAPCANEFP